MKFPQNIACVASYYDNDPKNIIMHSLVITKPKNDTIVVCNYYKLSDVDSEEAMDEIDEIIRSYPLHEIDVIFSDNPVEYTGMNLKMITKEEYRTIIKTRKARK